MTLPPELARLAGMNATSQHHSPDPGDLGHAAPPQAEVLLTREIESCIHAENFQPENLVDLFKMKPRIAELFRHQGVRDGYSIEEHTLMGLRQLSKYFPTAQFPESFGLAEMRLLYVLHDIGKAIPRDKAHHHKPTLDVIDSLAPELPLDAATVKILREVVGGDCMGRYFFLAQKLRPKIETVVALSQRYARGELRSEDLQEFMSWDDLKPEADIEMLAKLTAGVIHRRAARAGIPAQDMLRLLTIYYQSDTLAYTWDAARDPLRSRSYVFDPEVRFNGDKVLEPTPGLTIHYPGETASEAHRRIEQEIDLPRGYPSLDYLYEFNSGFDSAVDPQTSRMFVYDQSLQRVKFSAAFEKVYQALQCAVMAAA